MFAYQKSISKRFSKEASVVIDRNVSEFLDPVFEMDELKEVLEQDTPEKAIDKFSEFLKSQYLVEDILFTPKHKGYIFEVKNCMFSEKAHELFDEEDVACPYGLIAHYIVEKVTGRKTGHSLTKFNERDSITHIDDLSE